MKEKPRSYWMERLEALDVPYAPIYGMVELFQDAHIQHMGMEIAREKKPPIRTVRFPVDYGDMKVPLPGPPPELGEHNRNFLRPLGYDEKNLPS